VLGCLFYSGGGQRASAGAVSLANGRARADVGAMDAAYVVGQTSASDRRGARAGWVDGQRSLGGKS
jgi:hypothetical protein